jgi:phosphoglycerol transferase MdoB-like AlkP superfamily enzyme
MNFGSFYNRSQMAITYGYDYYYSSREMGITPKESYKDTHFMTNDKLKDLILPNNKFMSFIITYSTHTLYNLKALECSYNISNADREAIKNGANEEITCINSQAHETDDFFKLLIENLKKENKLDNTVIIGVTDHYTYGFTDATKIYKEKGTNDYNLMQKEPFFIWSSDMKPYKVTKASSMIDVLPTIANLFGLNWNPKDYLGQDILSDNYDDFVFFNDYSWYDGETYYKNGKIEMGKQVPTDYINERNKQLNDILTRNKYILHTDYFNIKNKK